MTSNASTDLVERDRLLTVGEVAKRLGVCVRLVWRYLSMGELNAVRLPHVRCTRVSELEVDRFISRAKQVNHDSISGASSGS